MEYGNLVTGGASKERKLPGSRNILTAKNGDWARETELVADMKIEDNSSDRDVRPVGVDSHRDLIQKRLFLASNTDQSASN